MSCTILQIKCLNQKMMQLSKTLWFSILSRFGHNQVYIFIIVAKRRVLTSVPIRVGRTYNVDVSECGTHSWSICMSRTMHLISSSPSNIGRPDLCAARFILSIFKSGRNNRNLSSTPRYALRPSNNCKIVKNYYCDKYLGVYHYYTIIAAANG